MIASRGAVAGAAVRLDRAGEGLADRLRGRRLADRTMYLASELGDFSLLWHLLGAARGLTSDDAAEEAVRLSAVLGLESLLVNGAVKQLVGRRRPEFIGERPHRLRQPRTSSFPSGHASAAFCAATLLAEGRRTWPLYYGLAAVVATSRVHVRIHHATDVVAGAALGVALGHVARRAWVGPRSPRRRALPPLPPQPGNPEPG
jgi:undecaprenyl-diphosphatase